MACRLPIFVVILSLSSGADQAFAQARTQTISVVKDDAAISGARLHGIVRDEGGHGVGGVSVLAMGATLTVVKSDTQGAFTLLLPFGEYVLRVAREGYLSTYREPIRVRTSATLERNITLVRTTAIADAVPPAAASANDALPGSSSGADDRVSSDAAWRLRHLTRTVLRDVSATDVARAGGTESTFQTGARSLGIGGLIDGPARAATAFFTTTDFQGQVNFLTTSSMAGTGGWLAQEWPRGLAYVALGAPVGTSGGWSARAAMGAGEAPAWTAAGEYDGPLTRTHVLRAGVSYSTQALIAATDGLADVPAAGSRDVGAAYAFDRWRPASRVEVDYGLRFDRYDYLIEPVLTSPRVALRLRVGPRVFARVVASRQAVAPGAGEFLPPVSSGPWLPPERTFSALVGGMPFTPEEVRHYEVGIEREFGSDRVRTLSLHRFSEFTTDQIATLFGLETASEVGHYSVATVGSASVEGWRVGLAGALWAPLNLDGRIEYVTAGSQWTDPTFRRVLGRTAGGVVRFGMERSHDVTASLDASIPRTRTHLSVAYRMNAAVNTSRRSYRRSTTVARFDVELRQQLPYQPLRRGTVNAVVAVRTLLRDLDGAGSFYDELLTVAPPMRVTCGFQVQF